MSDNYIESTELYAEIKKYQESGIMSEELGEMFLLLANKITNSKYFRRYQISDKNDMVSTAILDCVKAAKKFDISRSNAFAYFTSVSVNAFRSFLKKKYKISNFKMDMIEDAFHQNNKQFTNEIKKYILEDKQRKSKMKGVKYKTLGNR